MSDVKQWLTDQVSVHLGHPVVRSDVLLAEYGLDSVHAMGLAAAIEDEWGLVVDPAVTWDHPTIDELATFLTGELSRTADESAG
ncbi:acyl carrier protein [Saccharothrix coeruleofusca]|uniref:Phosphopantetheine attachment site domain protein n=1 Tax=Saccharothrix coeruleofusca TaxID=33919 RepID=A0A918EFI5_9PSEU|nr:acyl carrier protein [Saccharothrix coeruleofusca]MBP2334762.1 acyl carrier protein [Saccharothrix coeruleofusca]GGP74412.1 phosphopantetheine attachment site domain protein [Saccharothrix coeruleofusca]